MFIKNILRAFDRNTLVEIWLIDKETFLRTRLKEHTVGQIMDNGLMTYWCISEGDLYIEDGQIIINITN